MDAGARFNQLSQRFRDVNPWVIDACFGTVFTVAGLVSLLGADTSKMDYHPVDALGVLLSLGCTLPLFLARVNAGLGHNDEAINWLEQAYTDRSESIVWLKMDPSLESLRGEPRFKELVKRVGV